MGIDNFAIGVDLSSENLRKSEQTLLYRFIKFGLSQRDHEQEVVEAIMNVLQKPNKFQADCFLSLINVHEPRSVDMENTALWKSWERSFHTLHIMSLRPTTISSLKWLYILHLAYYRWFASPCLPKDHIRMLWVRQNFQRKSFCCLSFFHYLLSISLAYNHSKLIL